MRSRFTRPVLFAGVQAKMWRIVPQPPFDQDAEPYTERRIKMSKIIATKTTAPRSSGTTLYLRRSGAGTNG